MATSFDQKVSLFETQLHSIGVSKTAIKNITRVTSSDENYRMRTEFRIWHDGDTSNYAMHHPDTKEVYTLTDFPIASTRICEAMPIIIEHINNNELLRKRLFQIEFLSTLSGELLISLIYHKQLNEEWDEQAHRLSEKINAYIIGRARKQKRVLHQDFVIEELNINGQAYFYQQVENSFTQPNAKVCEKMIEWTIEHSQNSHTSDLLELYCGNGNFTLPLSQNFNRVLATEVSKTSVRSAQYNINKNKLNNIDVVRLSSEEFVDAYNNVRPFRRLKEIDLSSYNFSTIFVDPPRAGLDKETLKLVSQFKRIIYISCNPETLLDNLSELSSHGVTHIAAFDQFPNTHHLEVGIILEKNA